MKAPLWLPEGSIRAILALLMVGPVMARYALTGAVPDEKMIGLVLAAGAAYGIARITGKPSATEPPFVGSASSGETGTK